MRSPGARPSKGPEGAGATGPAACCVAGAWGWHAASAAAKARAGSNRIGRVEPGFAMVMLLGHGSAPRRARARPEHKTSGFSVAWTRNESGSGRPVGAIHRVQAEAFIPRRVPPMEELEARARAGSELRVLAQAPFESVLQRRVVRQHRARDLLGHVGFHVLLSLE